MNSNSLGKKEVGLKKRELRWKKLTPGKQFLLLVRKSQMPLLFMCFYVFTEFWGRKQKQSDYDCLRTKELQSSISRGWKNLARNCCDLSKASWTRPILLCIEKQHKVKSCYSITCENFLKEMRKSWLTKVGNKNVTICFDMAVQATAWWDVGSAAVHGHSCLSMLGRNAMFILKNSTQRQNISINK